MGGYSREGNCIVIRLETLRGNREKCLAALARVPDVEPGPRDHVGHVAKVRQMAEALRVTDESGDDYLLPASFFAPIELPIPLRRA